MVYFDHILHTNACQHYLTTGMCNSLFWWKGFAKHHLAGRGLLVKTLITLEPHGIFRSNFAYLIILTLSSHWYAKW